MVVCSRFVSASSVNIQDPTYARNVNSIDLNYVISSCATKTVSDSNTLPIWFGTTLPADLSAVGIHPQGDVYINIGAAATASTWKLSGGGYYRLPMTKTVADTVRIYAASGTAVTMSVEIPR